MKNSVIIAFPGSGKTTSVKAMVEGGRKALDFDMKGLRQGDKDINTAFVLGYLSKGYTVYMNNGLIDFYKLPKDVEIKMFIPCHACKTKWLYRISQRGDNIDFILEMSSHWTDWINDYANLYLNLKSCGYNVSLTTLDGTEYIGDFYGIKGLLRR